MSFTFTGLFRPRRKEMTQAQFVNGLRILQSIDLHELQAVGLFPETRGMSSQQAAKNAHSRSQMHIGWIGFRNDPFRFLMKCDDATAARIWRVMEKRRA